jgi:hypothetical protein
MARVLKFLKCFNCLISYIPGNYDSLALEVQFTHMIKKLWRQGYLFTSKKQLSNKWQSTYITSREKQLIMMTHVDTRSARITHDRQNILYLIEYTIFKEDPDGKDHIILL